MQLTPLLLHHHQLLRPDPCQHHHPPALGYPRLHPRPPVPPVLPSNPQHPMCKKLKAAGSQRLHPPNRGSLHLL
uniref:Uncharacterized protein n=1 Tax=Helianthus annuus TaxID=4232 RepID=A0A251TL62_HELAN